MGSSSYTTVSEPWPGAQTAAVDSAGSYTEWRRRRYRTDAQAIAVTEAENLYRHSPLGLSGGGKGSNAGHGDGFDDPLSRVAKFVGFL